MFQGVKMQGLTYNSAKNYISIFGSKLWLDSRYRVGLNEFDNVKSIGGLSSSSINYTQPRNDRSLDYSGGVVNSNASNGSSSYLFSQDLPSLKFLHGGGAFAVYAIVKIELADVTGSAVLLQTYLSGGDGIRITYASALNGRLYSDIYNAGSPVLTSYLSNVNPTEPGGVWLIHKFIFKGQGIASNVIVNFGNYANVATSGATFSSTSDSSTNSVFSNTTTGCEFKGGLLLAYDWDGKTSAEIDSLDTEVMELLNIDLIYFSTL